MLAWPAVALAVLAIAPGAADGEDRRSLTMTAVATGQLDSSTPILDGLDDDDVLVVRVTDGVPSARGTVRQCVLTVVGFQGCTNSFPVLFDDRGSATFQYAVDDPGRCDGTTACVVVVEDVGRARQAITFTVFGRSAPAPPVVVVAPAGPYVPGDEVGVEVSSLSPGTAVRTAFCAPSCGTTRRTVADDEGTSSSTVVIGERCSGCGIVIVGGASSSFVGVSFVPAPSPGYDAARLVAGLAAAGVFLVLAWRIIAAVDWRPPSEAATPELDVSLTD